MNRPTAARLRALVRPAFIASLLCATLGTPPIARAATYTVTGAGEPASLTSAACVSTSCPTLRDAINTALANTDDPSNTIQFAQALSGASINLTWSSNDISKPNNGEFGPSAFYLPAGTTPLTIDATINNVTSAITIQRSTVSGTPNFRLFDLGVGATLTLRGLVLANGVAQGGNSNLGGGGAMGAGGAIFSQGALTLDRCTVTGNAALGGAIFISGGNGGAGVGANAGPIGIGGGPNRGAAGVAGGIDSLGNGESGGNGGNGGLGGGGGKGGDGGGGGLDHTGGNGGNGGNGGFGGGGGKGGSGGLGGGGGGFAGSGGNGGFGGGCGIIGTNANFSSPSSARVGSSGFGGGVCAGFDGSGAGGFGGGVFNDAGTLTITNTTFTANSAKGGNGRAYAVGNGLSFGGAIFNYSGTLALNGVTLSGNSVTSGTTGGGRVGSDGGAIYSLADGKCAEGGNTCTSPGHASLSMFNSVAVNNTGTGSSAPNDVVVNAINVTSGNPTSTVLTSSNNAIGVQLSVLSPSTPPISPSLTGDFKLATSLSNNVLPPQPGSPLIDAGNCSLGGGLSADQLGTARPQGPACDIGAVEVPAPVLNPVVLSGTTATTSTLNATSTIAATGYWLVAAAGSAAPTATEIKAGSNYGSVTVVASGNGAMSAGVVTQFTITGLSPGTTYDLYLVATSASGGTSAIVSVLGWTTQQLTQTIIFGAAPTLTVGAAAGTLSATGGASGNAVIFSTTSTTCTVSGTSVSAVDAGPCVVTANQAGNTAYSAASPVTQTITVNPRTTVSGTNPAGGGTISATLSGPSGCGFASTAFVAAAAGASGAPAGYSLPYGLFQFTTNGLCAGAPVTFTVTFPTAVPTNAKYFKFGRTPSNATAAWYVMPGVVVSGNTVTFQITDGQVGDDDLTANGVIVDPGGLAIPLPPATAVPALSVKGLALLTLLLGLMGVGRMRRRA